MIGDAVSNTRGLLVDFGGVVLRTPFELVPAFRHAHGLAPDVLAWSGPFEGAADELFGQVLDGTLGEREYWQIRAAEVARVVGSEYPHPPLHALFELPEEDLIRPEWSTLIVDRAVVGEPTAILTNDLTHFHPQEWVDGISILATVDHLVDLSYTDFRKPDPRGFTLAAETMGLPLSSILFVDDQPVNLAGAQAVGMPYIRFDPADVEQSMAEVAARLA